MIPLDKIAVRHNVRNSHAPTDSGLGMIRDLTGGNLGGVTFFGVCTLVLRRLLYLIRILI